MRIYEATCTKCWETFNPAPSLTREAYPDGPDVVWMDKRGFTPEDLEHGQREDGTDCGGDGQLEGTWGG